MNVDWLREALTVARGVALAVAPLAVLFFLFQLFLLRLPRRQVKDIVIGTVIAALGLFLFLFGVEIGFLPFGRVMGEALGALDRAWIFVAVSLVLGFVTTFGEPSVRILADQVEEASNGSIRADLVVYAVCVGVAIWVALGAVRIVYGIPLLYLLVPGYALVIALLWAGENDFMAVAADTGGVATGPLANTFLLALALGASGAVGERSALVEGFGFVALIALAPVISVMALGLMVRRNDRQKE